MWGAWSQIDTNVSPATSTEPVSTTARNAVRNSLNRNTGRSCRSPNTGSTNALAPRPRPSVYRPPVAECGMMSARPDSHREIGPQQWDCLCWFCLCYGHESRSGFAAK